MADRAEKRPVQLRVPADLLAEIDGYAAALQVTRTEYLLSSALARGRGGHDTAEALEVIRAALERAGEL